MRAFRTMDSDGLFAHNNYYSNYIISRPNTRVIISSFDNKLTNKKHHVHVTLCLAHVVAHLSHLYFEVDSRCSSAAPPCVMYSCYIHICAEVPIVSANTALSGDANHPNTHLH